ncbi:MAG: hypothetical protein Q9210_002512 [Variospora velana]
MILNTKTPSATSTSNRANDGQDNAENDPGRRPTAPIWKRIHEALKKILYSSQANILLVFVPIGIACKIARVNPTIIFAMNAVAIVPLAGLLSTATESAAHRVGDTPGALINVSFGNAVELIIFNALVKKQIRIVQASLIGSILTNLLLILGMSFLVGGLYYREQYYNSTVTQLSACLLCLAVLSLLIPTAFYTSFSDTVKARGKVLLVSRGTAVVLLFVYGLYLLFQLKSHAYMYKSRPQHIVDGESDPGILQTMDRSRFLCGLPTSGHARPRRIPFKRIRARLGRKRHTRIEPDIETEENSEPATESKEAPFSKKTSILLLLGSTALVALCAEFMVGSIGKLVENTPLSEAFVGLIILPIVGNAAEHVTAVTVAKKNKMDLAIGVAIGSSIQIALFITPVVVLIGWWTRNDMPLYFTLFETVTLFVATLVVNFLVLDGRSNYLEGALLCSCYIIIAVATFFFPDVADQSKSSGPPGQRVW